MSEKSDKLRAMLAKEKERRIKLNNRIEILERRMLPMPIPLKKKQRRRLNRIS